MRLVSFIWFKKNRQIFTNYHFYGFPFTYVNSIPDLESMKSGFFTGDELWSWLDSWEGKSEKQRLISAILLKSRKRDITICYSTQSLQQINKRVRDITDFIAYPVISVDGTYCRMEIFRGPKPSISTRINPARYFNVEPVLAMFNTYEEIQAVNMEGEFQEKFFDIKENPAWLRYLKEQKHITSDREIESWSTHIQKSVNPDGYRSEKERKDKLEDFSAM